MTPLLVPGEKTESVEWLLSVTAAAKQPIASFLQKNASEGERNALLTRSPAPRVHSLNAMWSNVLF